jgi:hypothetical protein
MARRARPGDLAVVHRSRRSDADWNTTTMRAFRPLLAAALAALSACGHDSPAAPRADYLGYYQLVRVDGQELPVTLFDDASGSLTVTAGDLDLAPSSHAILSISFAVETPTTPPLTEAIVCAGTHARSGDRVTVTLPETSNCGGSFEGTLKGDTLTVTDASEGTLVYVKQP